MTKILEGTLIVNKDTRRKTERKTERRTEADRSGQASHTRASHTVLDTAAAKKWPPETPAKDEATKEKEAKVNPVLRQQVADRIEALLLKHEPDLFPQVRAQAETDSRLARPSDPRLWGPTLAYWAAVAAFLHVVGVDGEWQLPWNDEGNPAWRRVERNRTLLVRLVLRGMIARGEYIPQSNPKNVLKNIPKGHNGKGRAS